MHKMPLERTYPEGYPDYTLLLVKTEAFFEIDGKLVNFHPNTVILYGIRCPVRYGCQKPHYNDDWIHFDTRA